MKLTLEKNDIVSQLTALANVIEKRNTLPILANVAIIAEVDTVTLKATDLDIEMTASVVADIQESGSVTVNAALLLGLVKKFDAGKPIKLDDSNGRLSVRSGRSNTNLGILPIEDFPSLSETGFTTTIDMHSIDFMNILHKCSFAQSTDETRYYLNGIYLHHIDDKMIGVATDGSKLAKVSLDCDVEFDGVIIPRKTVAVIQKSGIEGDISVSVSDGKIKIDCDTVTITSKVVDGTFPDYTRVIPTTHTNELSVDAKKFKHASSLVAMVSDDRTSKVSMIIGNDNIELSVNGSGNGNQSSDVIPASVNGENLTIAFNSKYLEESMANSDTGEVTLAYGGPMDPAVITGKDNGDYLAVVMPMRG